MLKKQSGFTLAEVLSYLNIFYNVYKEAGFHKIDLYWLDNKTMGIAKDEFTSKIPPQELRKMAIENKLVYVNNKLIDGDKMDTKRVRYSVWVRYNPTDTENKNYERLRNILLKCNPLIKNKRLQ